IRPLFSTCLDRPDEGWLHVLWSDETKINLFGVDLARDGHNDCTVPTMKHGGGTVLIRGSSAKGVGEMTFIDDTMNASLCSDINFIM
uniref:Uncharacterized protein n=1 Tax=Seriola dumerili TaxID=41447 RepID=A0A3B4U647_SERDU